MAAWRATCWSTARSWCETASSRAWTNRFWCATIAIAASPRGVCDEDRRGDVLYDRLDAAGAACQGAGGARLRIALGARAHPHPVLAQDRLSCGRRPDQALLRHHGPV